MGCRQSAPDHGAVLVEYALVLALVVGAAFVAFTDLGVVGGEQLERQAVCVATRSPIACNGLDGPE